jgi:hypothetical protein
MTASEDSLQKLIYQLFKTASTYALTISAAKTAGLIIYAEQLNVLYLTHLNKRQF